MSLDRVKSVGCVAEDVLQKYVDLKRYVCEGNEKLLPTDPHDYHVCLIVTVDDLRPKHSFLQIIRQAEAFNEKMFASTCGSVRQVTQCLQT